MEGGEEGSTSKEPPEFLVRETLALSTVEPGVVLQKGETGFPSEIQRLYAAEENNALEELCRLKAKLRTTAEKEFWKVLVEGLATIAGSQYGFVSKRILVDDENIAVEMPPIGEPGACLMGAAFYISDGHGFEKTFEDFKYAAYSCPCAYMKHDKVFVIPDRLNDFVINNPNKLVVPGEAYLGVPLFAEGKCFAHFGIMYSPEGASKRALSWAFLELIHHSLEDMILDRMLQGRDFAKTELPSPPQAKVVPHEAVTIAQSLKPYARSLSHELRTPMHGVVGMLDVMYATVQEAAENQLDPRVRRVFNELKENIEIVQDSSRRAVEAADNVVLAYDMNMAVPDTPLSPMDEGTTTTQPRPDSLVMGSAVPVKFTGGKRRRESIAWAEGSPPKIQATQTAWSKGREGMDGHDFQRASVKITTAPAMRHEDDTTSTPTIPSDPEDAPDSPVCASGHSVVPGLRHASIRAVLQYVINDALKVGGRPESAIAVEIPGGESIEVRVRSPSGEEQVKHIQWSVDTDVPETILIDEKDLAKMVSCVVLNAIKFTDEGRIYITAKMSPKNKHMVIRIKDSGSGIPAAFLPRLFKPYSRADSSTTRQSEGLGLGLLVAKGLARKLGGDLFCIHSEVDGPAHGSEFEMRIPLTAGDVCSRPGSPTPSVRSRVSAEGDVLPPDLSSIHRQSSPAEPRSTNHNSRRPRGLSISTHDDRSASPVARVRKDPLQRNRPKSSNGKKTEPTFDRSLAAKHPLTFLVAEDNKINRKLLVNMLRKLGYTRIYESYDGADAARQMTSSTTNNPDSSDKNIDVILMDLWMPFMDGYEATEKILGMRKTKKRSVPTILAVTADVTDGTLERAAQVGMTGIMTKPYKLLDLERLILEYCVPREAEASSSNSKLDSAEK